MDIQHLKDIANKLGLTVHHNIGEDKLKAKIMEKCKEMNTTINEVSNEVKRDAVNPDVVEKEPPKTVSKEKKVVKVTIADLLAKKAEKEAKERTTEAMRLVRCIITSNNKNKTDYSGEIFSVQNAVLPEVKKFVPFGVVTHVPQILLNSIKEKKCQIFKKTKVNGNTITTPHMINEYNIDVLPPISASELAAIKQKQLAEGFNGE